MKTAICFLLLSATACLAGPEPSVTNSWREMDATWHKIEPRLFSPDGPKKYDAWVRCTGSPISLRPPVTIKLDSGVIVQLTKLQGAEREQLAEFRQPPSKVTVFGPILAVNAATRTITIKAVSTMFAP